MSFHAIKAVLAASVSLSQAEFAVLVVLANFADDHGGNCWPSQTTIAKLARTTQRSVRRVISQLSDREIVQVLAIGNGVKSCRYRLRLDQLSTPDTMSAPDTMSTPDTMSANPGRSVRSPRTPRPPTPDVMSADPVIEPVTNQSRNIDLQRADREALISLLDRAGIKRAHRTYFSGARLIDRGGDMPTLLVRSEAEETIKQSFREQLEQAVVMAGGAGINIIGNQGAALR